LANIPQDRLDLPAVLLGSLGGAITIALWSRGESVETSLAATGAWFAYVAAVWLTQADGRFRLIANYLAVCALYGSSTALIDALRVPVHSAELLSVDQRWLGETPSVAIGGVFSAGMNDLWSAFYLSYHIYLHWALIDALLRNSVWRQRYERVVFSTFAIGFAGYFLWPACGPEVAFPELYASPLQGGALTRLNNWVVATLASRYDAFPSLHVLVTASLLSCDWRWYRLRLWIMLCPALGMMFATLPLRLHYAVDLLASAVLIGPVLLLTSPRKTEHAS